MIRVNADLEWTLPGCAIFHCALRRLDWPYTIGRCGFYCVLPQLKDAGNRCSKALSLDALRVMRDSQVIAAGTPTLNSMERDIMDLIFGGQPNYGMASKRRTNERFECCLPAIQSKPSSPMGRAGANHFIYAVMHRLLD